MHPVQKSDVCRFVTSLQLVNLDNLNVQGVRDQTLRLLDGYLMLGSEEPADSEAHDPSSPQADEIGRDDPVP